MVNFEMACSRCFQEAKVGLILINMNTMSYLHVFRRIDGGRGQLGARRRACEGFQGVLSAGGCAGGRNLRWGQSVSDLFGEMLAPRLSSMMTETGWRGTES